MEGTIHISRFKDFPEIILDDLLSTRLSLKLLSKIHQYIKNGNMYKQSFRKKSMFIACLEWAILQRNGYGDKDLPSNANKHILQRTLEFTHRTGRFDKSIIVYFP